MLLHVSLPLLQLLGMDMYGLGTCAGNTVVLGAVCYTQGRLSLQLSVADAQINDFLNVSLTHTECRLTGGVCSLDTGRAPPVEMQASQVLIIRLVASLLAYSSLMH